MLEEAQAETEQERGGERAAPAVSVLVPVRNCAVYLDEALESLAAQTFADFEIVVVDNGSTDETPAILARWAEREPRLRAVRLDGPGLAESLNHAAALARAPLLARLDGDDIALPHRLAIQVEAMRSRPGVGLLGSCAEIIDSGGAVLGALDRLLGDAELRAFMRSGCGFIHSTVMMRREAFLAAGRYRDGLNCAEDYDLWLRMGEVTELANLPDRLVRYRVHPASTTARRPARQALCVVCVAAAQEARRLGRLEPFANGVPRLRAALPLLGRSRSSLRRQLRLAAFRLHVSQVYLGLPLHPWLKAGLRRAAIGLGLRPIYLLGLRGLVAIAPLRT